MDIIYNGYYIYTSIIYTIIFNTINNWEYVTINDWEMINDGYIYNNIFTIDVDVRL